MLPRHGAGQAEVKAARRRRLLLEGLGMGPGLGLKSCKGS